MKPIKKLPKEDEKPHVLQDKKQEPHPWAWVDHLLEIHKNKTIYKNY